MKDYLFILVIVALAVFFIVREIRNDNIENKLQSSNKALQVEFDSLSLKIDDLEKLILQLDSVKIYNNNYYTEVIKESDEIIKADSNAVNGLIRKQLYILANSN